LLLANDACWTAAQFCNFVAFSLAPVIALVNVVNGVQPLFVLLLGVSLTLWFPHVVREEIGKGILLVKAASILLLFAGVFCVSV